MLDVNSAYVYLLFMRHTTPFFRAFGPLLFGKPPVSALAQAFAIFSKSRSLSDLRKAFGSFVPHALLQPQPSGLNSRKRIFSLEVVFWSFFDQVQTPNGSCREAVRKVMAFVRRKLPSDQDLPMSANTSAYCQGRARIPLDVMDKINLHLVERMDNHIPKDQLWHGHRVRLVDGTGISMPDTPENQASWPQSKSQKPGCGFPLMNLVGIFCLHSGALIRAAHGNRFAHETKLFKSLWATLKKGDVLVADRGFCSYGAMAALMARGVHTLMRLPENKIRKAIGSKLPKSDSFDVLISWKRPTQRPRTMTPEEYAALPKTLFVRVVRYKITQKGYRTQSVTLATTLLETSIPAADLAKLYLRRWGIELNFREIKIHLNMDVLRCLTPHLIERELRMHFIAYNAIRCLMQKAALTHHVELKRISFKGCLDTVRQFANATSGAEEKPRTISTMLEEMLLAIAKDLNPRRPGRSEPRVKKRRPKNYRLMTKPRHEMGPLPHRKVGVENTPKTALS